jgi:hypothetical protein
MLKYLKVEQIAALDIPGFAKSHHDVSSSTPVPVSADVRHRPPVGVSYELVFVPELVVGVSEQGCGTSGHAKLSLCALCGNGLRSPCVRSAPLPDIDKVRLIRAHFDVDQYQNSASAGILTTNLQCSSFQGLSCESSTGRTSTECLPCHFSLDGMGGLVLGELQGTRVRLWRWRAGCNPLGCATDQRQSLPWPHIRRNDRRLVHFVDSAADFLTHFQAIGAAGSGKKNMQALSSGQSSPFGHGSLHLQSVTATVLSPYLLQPSTVLRRN